MSPTSLMELQNLCRLLKMSNNSLKDPKSKEIEVWITELHQVKLELWTETIGFSSYLWSSFGLVVIVHWFAICVMWNCFGSVLFDLFLLERQTTPLSLDLSRIPIWNYSQQSRIRPHQWRLFHHPQNFFEREWDRITIQIIFSWKDLETSSQNNFYSLIIK